MVTGTPIRALAGEDRAAARARLGLPPDLPVLLVFGGSQAVRRLNEAMADAIGDLVQRCCVVHVAGPSAIEQAEALRAALPSGLHDRYRPFAFLLEDMDAALVAADLLVGRAGSSTLAEAAAAGLPMIVVPYPHAAAHQRANAAEMVEAGAALLVDDEDLDGDTLRRACDLLFEPRLGEMSAAATRVGRPGQRGGHGRPAGGPRGAPPAADAGRAGRTDEGTAGVSRLAPDASPRADHRHRSAAGHARAA